MSYGSFSILKCREKDFFEKALDLESTQRNILGFGTESDWLTPKRNNILCGCAGSYYEKPDCERERYDLF